MRAKSQDGADLNSYGRLSGEAVETLDGSRIIDAQVRLLRKLVEAAVKSLQAMPLA